MCSGQSSLRIEMLTGALALLFTFALLDEVALPVLEGPWGGVSPSDLDELYLAEYPPPAMNKTKVTVKVRVVGDKMTSLMNATVRLVQNDALPSMAASDTTNQDGYAAFCVPASVYRIEIERSSIFEKPHVKVVALSSNTSVVLQLKDQGNKEPGLRTAPFLGILLSALVIIEATGFPRRSENRPKETVSE